MTQPSDSRLASVVGRSRRLATRSMVTFPRAYPELEAGSYGRLDPALMRLGHNLIAESGAEGYFRVGHHDGLGLTVKIQDGDGAACARPLATVMAARRLGWIADDDPTHPLSAFGPSVPVRNVAGRQAGDVQPAAILRVQQAVDKVR